MSCWMVGIRSLVSIVSCDRHSAGIDTKTNWPGCMEQPANVSRATGRLVRLEYVRLYPPAAFGLNFAPRSKRRRPQPADQVARTIVASPPAVNSSQAPQMRKISRRGRLTIQPRKFCLTAYQILSRHTLYSLFTRYVNTSRNKSRPERARACVGRGRSFCCIGK